MTRPPRDALLGAHLERRYRIDALIARGGMSSVYLGMDLRLHRPVAIKVMDPKFAHDSQFLARLEFEARSVAQLKHPALAAVYDQGIDDEYAFLVMELVEGGTLRELLRERGPMPPHAVAAVALPVLGALGEAHRAGLVHRDIKPENVLVSRTGEIKVVDFGLVRAVAAAGMTSASVILGTAAYLSPEQVESATADARSDVYATGILLFELLTGTTPFSGDTAIGLAYARLGNDVPPPSRLIPGVPPQFDELVLTATARDPRDRYADGDDMADAVADIIAELGLPPFIVPAPRESAEQIAARRSRQAPAADAPTPAYLSDAPGPVYDGRVDGAGYGHTVAEQHIPPPPPRNHTRIQTLPPDTRHEPPAPAFASPPPARMDTADAPAWRGTGEWADPGYGLDDGRIDAAIDEFAERRARHRRTALIIGVIVVIAALIIGLGGWWLGSGRLVAVPDVRGMTKQAAVTAVRDAGLDPKDDPFFSDTVARWQVTDSDPPAGAKIARDSDVRITFSAGAPVIVPASSGRTEAAVRAALEAAGLKPGEVRKEFDAGVDGGSVIRTDPPAGDKLLAETSVALVVSTAITVPDVAGVSPAEANTRLRAAGLTPVEGGKTSEGTADRGQAAVTEPRAGTRVDPASPEVTVLVSDATTVPDVKGLTLGTARTRMEKAGLTVKVNGLIPSAVSIVTSQSIWGGQRVKEGTEVTLTTIP